MRAETQRVDDHAIWPTTGMQALAEAGLLKLTVPSNLGGHGQGLLATALVTETLARGCPSTALCFGMHCVASAVIGSKATPYQIEKFVQPIVEGRHITTLALSEVGTGSHFYMPETELSLVGNKLSVQGSKAWITNGSHADSYVVSARLQSSDWKVGEFSCFVIENDTPGLTWGDPWKGIGMRGNSSRGMTLDQVTLPADNLLGEHGDQIWYIFEVVAPYFLMAMSGTYLGIAAEAFDIARDHIKARTQGHTGGALAGNDLIQAQVADLWIEVEKTRQFLHHAAELGDHKDPTAREAILASKIAVARAVNSTVDGAMALGGGQTYGEAGRLGRLMRDAKAVDIMSPTTNLLKLWLGRALLDQPIL